MKWCVGQHQLIIDDFWPVLELNLVLQGCVQEVMADQPLNPADISIFGQRQSTDPQPHAR